MRFVQVSIPVGRRTDVLAVLDDAKIDYVITESTGDQYEAVVSFPLPVDDVKRTVERPVESAYPTLATTHARRLSEHTGYDVVVAVRFVDTDRSDTVADRSLI